MFSKVKSEWAIGINCVVVHARSQSEAWEICQCEYKELAEAAARLGFKKAWVRYPGSQGFEIDASMHDGANEDKREEVRAMMKIFPVLEIANGIPLTDEIRTALNTIASNPDDRWVLVRLEEDLETQVQVAMSESMQACIVGANIKQALNRDRTEYFHPQDLIDLKRDMRRSDHVRVSWRGFSPVTKQNWRRFEYDYRIVDRCNGYLWQLGRCMDVTPIAAPLGR